MGKIYKFYAAFMPFGDDLNSDSQKSGIPFKYTAANLNF